MTAQICFIFLLAGPMIWGLYNLVKYRSRSAAAKVKADSESADGSSVDAYPAKLKVATVVNSSVFYALAYNLIFFLQELFLVLGKKAIGLKSSLFHNNHTWEGEHPMTDLMQGSGALAIFLIGLLALVLFFSLNNSKSPWKLFLLWFAFHGLIQSIPQVIFALLDPGTDVGEALVVYLQLSQPLLIFMAVLSTLLTALISVWICRPLLGFAPTDGNSSAPDAELYFSNPKTKARYIRFIAVGGALLGSLLVVPFRILPMSQAITPFLVFMFSVPWTWAAAPTSKYLGQPAGINNKIYWQPILALVLLLLFFQVVLAPGVEF